MSGRGRGRRPTKVVEKQETSEIIDIEQTNGIKNEKSAKKTSRKKQFPVVAVITPEGIEGNLLPEVRRPLIVHLPIQSKDIVMNDMPIAYNPLPPTEAQPYDSNLDNPFYDGVEQLSDLQSTNEVVIPIETVSAAPSVINKDDKKPVENVKVSEQEIDFYNLKSTLLVKFGNSSEVRKIPESTDAACFWCCHTFAHRPVVLPIRDTGEYLQVTGNFCCPECACAYLFGMRQEWHTRWEQMALLHRVYGDACQGKIHPAPSRHILSIFGGNLSIQDYRALIRSYKVRVDIHLPPMVSILATMDTKPIDFYDSSLTKNVTETVKERLQKAEEVLRLRRTKPLKAWESTLDACLNLKIKNDGVTTV
jgi:hypothetical protein